MNFCGVNTTRTDYDFAKFVGQTLKLTSTQ